jgi:hypothetical protein
MALKLNVGKGSEVIKITMILELDVRMGREEKRYFQREPRY